MSTTKKWYIANNNNKKKNQEKGTEHALWPNYHKAHFNIAQIFMTVFQKSLFQNIYKNTKLIEIYSE